MNILLIEDEPDLRRMLRSAIDQDGWRTVKEAENGFEAMEILNDGWIPDVCFVDLLIPGLSAVDFLELLKADPKYQGIQIIVCSAGMDGKTLRRTSHYGVLAYLQKPIAPQAVTEALCLSQAALISHGRWPFAHRFANPEKDHGLW